MHQAGYSEAAQLERVYRNSTNNFQLEARRHEFTSVDELVALAMDFDYLQLPQKPTSHKEMRKAEHRQVALESDRASSAQSVHLLCSQQDHY